jgi:hypothetical protein
MARAWTTFKFPLGPNGEWYPICQACDGMVLIPRNPALLIDGVAYLQASILTGPVLQDEELVYTVDYEDTLLADPTATLKQCDYRICCNDCSLKLIQLTNGVLNDRMDEVEGIVDAIVIPDPHMFVLLGQDDLAVDTVNNDGALVFADPYNTFAPDFESVVYNFTNPSLVKSMKVSIKGFYGTSHINASPTRYQSLFVETYIKVDGTEIPLSIQQNIKTCIPGSSNQTLEIFPTAVITLAPGASADIQVGGRSKRVSGSAPEDDNTLRVDARHTLLKEILGVTV